MTDQILAEPPARARAPTGLSSVEAARRLQQDGSNTIATVTEHPVTRALAKLWARVPWILEAAIVLQLGLREFVEAAVIAFLLLFNAALGFVQESRAQATLDALKSRMALIAPVLRDGTWTKVAATTIVRGDLVKLSLGSVVAADIRVVEGSILIDQSMLTGESLPVEASAGGDIYAARWCGVAKPWGRLLRWVRRPSSAGPPNWSGRPRCRDRSRRRSCGSCATWPCSTGPQQSA